MHSTGDGPSERRLGQRHVMAVECVKGDAVLLVQTFGLNDRILERALSSVHQAKALAPHEVFCSSKGDVAPVFIGDMFDETGILTTDAPMLGGAEFLQYRTN